MDFKRASFASQLGVFKKPKEHVLVLNSMKMIYKLQLIRENVVCRRQIVITPNYIYHVVYLPL